MVKADSRRRLTIATSALAALVALLALGSLGTGPVRLSPLTVLEALLGGGTDIQRIIVGEIRLPRMILGLSIGAILGLSGAALQGLLRNPLASPSAVRRAAIGGVRRGADHRTRLGRRAVVCAAGGRHHDGLCIGVRAARHRRAKRRPAAADPVGTGDFQPGGGGDRAGDEPVVESVCRARNRVLAARLAGRPQLSPCRAGAAVHRPPAPSCC